MIHHIPLFSRCALLLTLFLCAGAGQTQPQTADLRGKFVPGQEVRYLWKSHTVDNLTTGDGQTTQRENSFEAVVLIRMGGDIDARQAELIYESLKVRIVLFSGPMEFDSSTPVQKDEGNSLAFVYRPIVGTPLKLTIDQQGAITGVTGIQALMNVSPRMASTRGQLVDVESLQRKFGPIFSTGRNSEAVAAGESWNTSEAVPLTNSQHATVQKTNTLSEIKDGQAIIKFEGISTPDQQPIEDKSSAVLAKAVKIAGELSWDSQAGQLSSLNLTQEISITSENKGLVMRTNAEVKSSLTRQ